MESGTIEPTVLIGTVVPTPFLICLEPVPVEMMLKKMEGNFYALKQ